MQDTEESSQFHALRMFYFSDRYKKREILLKAIWQEMAPIFVTAPIDTWALQPTVQIYPYLYPSAVTRIFHPIASPASLLPTVIPASSTSPSSAVDVLLVFAIVLALVGTMAIIWICLRHRSRRVQPPPAPKMAQQPSDTGNPFAVQNILMPRPDLIMHMQATETKATHTLLQEVPSVWRILGRPNVATQDDFVDDAIPDYRNKTA
ncbi:hypothetical protein C8F01DRAFT_1250672 [Mycena amicta]|nr:hypothetical protein C8F01DRAFT_1250672 [Mycena amicta]